MTPLRLAEELALLEPARAIVASEPVRALSLLGVHEARFPGGALADEREILTIGALRNAGRADEARDRAHAWLVRDPDGMHARRVRVLLGELEGALSRP